ncbi:O-phosphoseryl-tRNA(Sec) selenium transferase isoform X1 [Daphnia magna]|uniref:O-phosphoseryl-tRNA(Sec) selenium transferase isoform X1 n=1 Tax=Daphnia magna TaxID=35525 RepID=UPI001E1BBB7E|nr:O-phosphoseryl-tRNA(Sec) selenium transferase isoform X1 [Daphnia magna]
MDETSFKLLAKYLPSTYVQQAKDARNTTNFLFNQLLEKGKWPEEGWSERNIEILLDELASLDSNNFLKNHGVGEREARIASSLVAKRNFHLGHGLGRSGDLTEVQPKAAGSSVLYQLTNDLARDVLRTLGVPDVKACFVAPLATGMSLTLIFLCLRQQQPKARYIIWSRIDQKSCFKSITTAGFEPIIVEPILNGDELVTDTGKIEAIMKQMNPELIACVMTTTSCFAPRACDDVETVAVFCKIYRVAHVINNAYGVQSTKCMHVIQQACKKGRVDAFVQSTDKNFMVPVGGTIIAGFDKSFVNKISQCYPGRASSSPIVDLFITLLSLGSKEYKTLARERKHLFQLLKEGLAMIASRFGLRVLDTPGNSISIGISLPPVKDPKLLTQLGSQLFLRCVSGTRVVSNLEIKVINGHEFRSWGAHHSNYPTGYLTAAATIGMTAVDVEQFLKRLTKVMESWSTKTIPMVLPSLTNGHDGFTHLLTSDHLVDQESSVI